jgi:hypothetical protein
MVQAVLANADKPVTTTTGRVVSTPASREKERREKIIAKDPSKYSVEDYKKGIQEPGAENDVLSDPIAMAAALTAGGVGLGAYGLTQVPRMFARNLASEATAGLSDYLKLKRLKPNITSSVDDVGRGLTRNTNELPPPPHEIILDEHAFNLERLAPKNKRKMRSFDDSDIGSGLTLRNNPSRVENVEDILGKNRSIKSVMNKETGESIDLKTWRDADGKLYYYMSANMPSSKIKAGRAYMEIEKHIPKGASLLENSSLSYDSFLNILKQTKNPKFETFVKGSVPMNNAAKNASFKTKPRETSPLVEFANKNHADDAVNELNLLLDKYNLPKASVTNEYGNYSIQLPNIGLKKLYSIIGLGGAGVLGAETLQQPEKKAQGGPIYNWIPNYPRVGVKQYNKKQSGGWLDNL